MSAMGADAAHADLINPVCDVNRNPPTLSSPTHLMGVHALVPDSYPVHFGELQNEPGPQTIFPINGGSGAPHLMPENRHVHFRETLGVTRLDCVATVDVAAGRVATVPLESLS
jgi:hypothetical protein